MDHALIAIGDELLPGLHTHVVAAAAVVMLVGSAALWLAGFRFQWRKDQREDRDSVAVLMGRLVDQQRAELVRLVAEVDAMRSQIDLFIEGRWQFQQALDELREQLIAARIAIHDYERRLGLPETDFPALPVQLNSRPVRS